METTNMNENKLCPVCEEGTLIPHQEEYTFSPKIRTENGFEDAEYEVTIIEHFSICDVCHSHVVDPEQSKINKEQILAEKAKYE